MAKLGLIPLRDRVREIARIYNVAQKMISQEMLSLDVENFQEMQAIKVEDRVTRLVRILNRKTARWAKSAIPAAYKQAYGISKTSLEILGKKPGARFYPNQHLQTVDEYIDFVINDFLKANMSIKQNVAMYIYLTRQAVKSMVQIQAWGDEDAEAIENLIQEAIERGEKPGYAVKLIRAYFQAQIGDGKFIQVGNRHYKLGYYSRLVARTRMRDVQTEAVKNTCEQYGNDLVEVSMHGTDCAICAPHEGEICSLSGKHPTYPMFDDSWMHPNCEHSIHPTSEEAIEVSKEWGTWGPAPND